MKRSLAITLVIILGVFNVCFAAALNENEQQQGQIGINKNDVDNTNQQQQGQIGINRNDNRDVNINDNRDYNQNRQGQLQGQGQDQGQGQGQFAVGKVDVADNSEVKTTAYSFAPPALSSNKGMNEGNIYSIFGGIGLSEDSEYVLAVEKIAVIERLEKLGYIGKEEAVSEARSCLIQLKDSTKPKRLLGFGPRTRGRHLLNFFGLAAFDSFVNEDKVNTKILQKEINAKLIKE